ncbi:MAG TPA: TolC family protein [Gallionella sp.]|nr:TolC family protein [Gallionella sp.]
MRKLFLAVALLAAGVSAAAGELLTEAQSVRQGLARPEVAELANSTVGEAEANAIEAGLWANPTLEYLHDRTRGVPGTSEQIWQVNQPLDVAGRRGLKGEAGARRTDAVRAGNAGQRAELAAAIKRRYYEVLLKQEVARSTESWLQQLGRAEHIFTLLQQAGEVSGYDRRRLARERQLAQARLAIERGELVLARERLAALTGVPDDPSPGVAGALLPPAPPQLDAVLARLAEQPVLRELAFKADAAVLEGKAAARGWLPEVTAGIGTKQISDGVARGSGPLVSLSVPLPLFDHQQGARHRAAAQEQGARADYQLTLARFTGEARGLHRQLEHLIAAATAYRRDAVVSSGDLVRIAEAAYQAGESTLLELLDAYKGALETETTALDLEWKARQACIEFDLLTGSIPE